jgi:hypothetical protein
LEGKYFKAKQHGMLVYKKVIEITPEYVSGNATHGVSCYCKFYSFSILNNYIDIRKDRTGSVEFLGTEITETEFLTAWNELMTTLDTLG